MRLVLFALPALLLAACTDMPPDGAAPVPAAPGDADSEIAAVPPLDPGPPDPRTTVVDDSTGVVTPSGEVLANANRLDLGSGSRRVDVTGAGPHRYLVAVESGQRLAVETEGSARASVFDPGGKPLAEGTRSWSGTVAQTADFVVEASGSGVLVVQRGPMPRE